MEIKEVGTVCPCCQTRLTVDVRSGKVLRSQSPLEHDSTGKRVIKEGDWLSASERVSSRLDSAADRFEQGLGREKSREQDLDELFRKTSEKVTGEEEETEEDG